MAILEPRYQSTVALIFMAGFVTSCGDDEGWRAFSPVATYGDITSDGAVGADDNCSFVMVGTSVGSANAETKQFALPW